jgi:uncharacterized protein YbaR (Trm112 family)
MQHEEFADPVIVPGPNLRSLFTDTEQVDEPVAASVDDDALFCPACRRAFPAATLACPDDGDTLVELPPPVQT